MNQSNNGPSLMVGVFRFTLTPRVCEGDPPMDRVYCVYPALAGIGQDQEAWPFLSL